MRRLLFNRNSSNSGSPPLLASNTAVSGTGPYINSSVRGSSDVDEYHTDMCNMIVLLQQVLEFIETEPNPEILKEQSLRLIDYIVRCCNHSKITRKKRIFGYD